MVSSKIMAGYLKNTGNALISCVMSAKTALSLLGIYRYSVGKTTTKYVFFIKEQLNG